MSIRVAVSTLSALPGVGWFPANLALEILKYSPASARNCLSGYAQLVTVAGWRPVGTGEPVLGAPRSLQRPDPHWQAAQQGRTYVRVSWGGMLGAQTPPNWRALGGNGALWYGRFVFRTWFGLVEAAGIEPAAEAVSPGISTSVSRILVLAWRLLPTGSASASCGGCPASGPQRP